MPTHGNGCLISSNALRSWDVVTCGLQIALKRLLSVGREGHVRVCTLSCDSAYIFLKLFRLDLIGGLFEFTAGQTERRGVGRV